MQIAKALAGANKWENNWDKYATTLSLENGPSVYLYSILYTVFCVYQVYCMSYVCTVYTWNIRATSIIIIFCYYISILLMCMLNVMLTISIKAIQVLGNCYLFIEQSQTYPNCLWIATDFSNCSWTTSVHNPCENSLAPETQRERETKTDTLMQIQMANILYIVCRHNKQAILNARITHTHTQIPLCDCRQYDLFFFSR